MNVSDVSGADGPQETIKKNSKDPATLKAKREANVTAGLGYGLKKKRILDAFWTIIWPGLEKLGWRRVQGEGINDGTEFFLPPHTEIKPSSKRVGDCYDKIKSIIERVEERRNKDEAKLADSFRDETRDDESITLLTNPRRVRGRPSLGASRAGQKIVDISWKDGGSLYPKRSSQVGEDYQVSSIPLAGTYQDKKETHEQAYELIWDHEKAAEKGAVDFVRDKVPYNKKEKALEAIHMKDYDLSAIDEIISQIRPSDGADWTPEERDKFHTEIFRNRKNLRALCKSSGTRMDNVLGYYLGKYKTSDDYRLLKTVCSEERIEKAESSTHVVDECAVCGDGGSLIICDGCESEWHMGCTKPALKTVPEGYWLCDRCVDRAFLDARQQIMQSARLFTVVQQDGGKKRKINAKDKKEDKLKVTPTPSSELGRVCEVQLPLMPSSDD